MLRRRSLAPRRRSGNGPPAGLERELAALFGSVLQVPAVGLDDDFFTLGGDSFSAVEVMLALEQRVGTSVPLPLLFEAPTPRELARSVRAIVGDRARAGASRSAGAARAD